MALGICCQYLEKTFYAKHEICQIIGATRKVAALFEVKRLFSNVFELVQLHLKILSLNSNPPSIQVVSSSVDACWLLCPSFTCDGSYPLNYMLRQHHSYVCKSLPNFTNPVMLLSAHQKCLPNLDQPYLIPTVNFIRTAFIQSTFIHLTVNSCLYPMIHQNYLPNLETLPPDPACPP